jgi:hypothetical protein
LTKIRHSAALAVALSLTGPVLGTEPAGKRDIERNAYFGDLHVHTKNSLDSFMFQVKVTPDDAYRYARGHAIEHTLGMSVQLRGKPMDFAAVTDHGELLGVLVAMADTDSSASKLPFAAGLRSKDRLTRLAAFLNLQRAVAEGGTAATKPYSNLIRSAWQETIDAAERHNRPGVFTTFVGYEYSSAPDNQNLHRNVLFSSARVPDRPFSAIESDNPEDLWRWLDTLRANGIDGLAIPHNSNVSNGLMFPLIDRIGEPLNAEYADLRMRNEPLVEITQVKGTSETHPSLSPNDEWADFELYDTLIASSIVARKSGGFVREAYRRGLEFQQELGINPYQFGLIGSTDTHNGGGSLEEDNYMGKVGVFDGTAQRRGAVADYVPATFGGADAGTTFKQWSASGLAGIWAESNTRASLFAAMRRKETFATSGPRITVRFFAGFEYADDLLADPDVVRTAYRHGVAMGGVLARNNDRSPKFLLWAVRDNNSASLQRLQIVKGWLEYGVSHERIFDVACSDGLVPDSENNRCPDNGARVDPADCRLDADVGATELQALWQDPTFVPSQQAFYYVRVLENPSCRWSTWDALRANATPQAGLESLLQERAWSSPIWYLP